MAPRDKSIDQNEISPPHKVLLYSYENFELTLLRSTDQMVKLD